MQNVIPFPSHTFSSMKSSAVTRPSVALRSAKARSRDSQTLPRRNLETVERSQSEPACRISAAISSSPSLRADMNLESFIEAIVHPAHNEVNIDCARTGMGVHPMVVHNMHMVVPIRKKLVPLPKKGSAQSILTKTYLRSWRESKDISLEVAAAEIGIKHSQLSRIERGQQEYKQSYLEGLARLYQTSVWALLYCPPNASPDQMWAIFQSSLKPLSRQ